MNHELEKDGQRWRAFINGKSTRRSQLLAAMTYFRCASCEWANVYPIPLVDPFTARVIEYSMLGDSRCFAFVCDGCAAAADEYESRVIAE